MTKVEAVEAIAKVLSQHGDVPSDERRCRCGQILWKEGDSTTMTRHRAERIADILVKNGMLKLEFNLEAALGLLA